MRISLPFPGARSGASRTKRGPQRWLIVPLILIIIAAIVVWQLQSRSTTTPTTTTATVSQDTLTINVSGSGTVAAARTVEVPFQQAGTITSVDVAVGDQVTTGQTLATIDAADLQIALDLAKANLATAQAQLEQTKNGTATAADLASAEAQLNSAQAQLEQTKTGTTTAAELASAQAQLNSAQAQYNALLNPSAEDLRAAQAKVNDAQLALQNTRDSASQQKTNAQFSLQNAVNSLTQTQVSYGTAKSNWDFVQATGQDPTNPETTDSTGKTTKNKLSDTQRQQYYDTFAKAEASLKSAENAVAQAQVAYDAARQSEIIQIQQAEAALVDAQAALDALHNPTATALAQAKASLASAQANLANLKKGATTVELAQAEAQVTQAQGSLDALTAPPTAAELASAEASVLQAQVALDTAQRNLEQATLKAPFDGVVSAVSVTPGSTASTGSAAVTIVDRSAMHVDISLSETDAAEVEAGQPVTLTFDAVPDVTLYGTVATVAPSATTSQNVVTYPVQITFDPGTTPVKIGMSATAEIQVEEYKDAILVPSRAVQTAGNTKVVTVLQGETPVSVRVETGATSDGQTIILNCVDTGAQCLRAGDTLQIASTTSTSAQTTNQNPSMLGGNFRMSGGSGGPPPGAP